MKTNFLCLLLFCTFLPTSQAQTKRAVFFDTGYTWNPTIKLNGESVAESKGTLLNLGFTYRFFTRQRVFSEIGVSGKSIFSSGKTASHSFKAATFRLTMPIKLVVPVLDEKLLLVGGFVLQNNVDFREFDFRFRDKYAWRLDGLMEVRYLLSSRFYLTLGFNWNLRNIPDAYFINDPKHAVSIGVRHTLKFTRKNTKS